MGHDFSQYAPVGKAEAARMQAAEEARRVLGAPLPEAQVAPVVVAPPAAEAAPALAPMAVSAPVAPKPTPPVFVGGRERSAVFPLDCPLSYDGRLYDAVVMRRPTAREVGAFYDALAEGGFQGFRSSSRPRATRSRTR